MRVNRVVTGIDGDGHAIIARTGPHEHGLEAARFGVEIVDLWRTDGPLADNRSEEDTGLRPYSLEPPTEGTVFRLIRFKPDSEVSLLREAAAGSVDPRFHVTRTTDYIVVVEGEIWAKLERGEVLLKQGDTLVQRGTVHAWSNRSSAPCMIAAVLVDARSLARGDAG